MLSFSVSSARPHAAARPGIIYCSTRKRTEELAAHLRERGIAADAYHAGLAAEERDRVQEAFIFDKIRIVVATVAFGMGIDKTNVRFVVHWDLPQHLEGYYQEIGRSGRDGLPANALLLFGWEDVPRVRALIDAGRERAAGGGGAAQAGRAGGLRPGAHLPAAGAARLPGGARWSPTAATATSASIRPSSTTPPRTRRRRCRASTGCGERFGVGHVVDVLRGSTNQRIARPGARPAVHLRHRRATGARRPGGACCGNWCTWAICGRTWGSIRCCS